MIQTTLEATPASLHEPTDWENMRTVLGKAGNAWLREAPPEAAVFDEMYGPQATSPAIERYVNLGDFMYGEFCSFLGYSGMTLARDNTHLSDRSQKQQTAFLESMVQGKEWRTILVGMHVFERMLSFAPKAYRQRCNEGSAANADQLGAILLHDDSFKNTAGFLASMPIAVTTVWEKRLQVSRPFQDLDPNAPLPFIIRQSDTGDAYTYNPEVTKDLTRDDTGQGCPAREVLLKQVWEHMVGICTGSEVLFLRDLHQTPSTVTPN